MLSEHMFVTIIFTLSPLTLPITYPMQQADASYFYFIRVYTRQYKAPYRYQQSPYISRNPLMRLAIERINMILSLHNHSPKLPDLRPLIIYTSCSKLHYSHSFSDIFAFFPQICKKYAKACTLPLYILVERP